MKNCLVAAFCVACLTASAEAIKTKEDDQMPAGTTVDNIDDWWANAEAAAAAATEATPEAAPEVTETSAEPAAKEEEAEASQ